MAKSYPPSNLLVHAHPLDSAFCDMDVTGIMQPAVHISVKHRVRSSSLGRSNG